MPKITLDGVAIAYDFIGDGAETAIITPGGRFSKDTPGVRPLAESLAAAGMRVLIWDRPNCGESDVSFDGVSESRMNADMMAGLLRALKVKSAMLIGGSAGSRVSLLTAILHPDVVDRLFLLWISGSEVSLAALAYYYCHDSLAAAAIGGMAAVIKLPGWEEPLRRNPDNRAKLLEQNVDTFMETMKRWAAAFFPREGCPVPDMLPVDIRGIKVPTCILRSGLSDIHHPRATSEAVHALIPSSVIAEPPWGDREWLDCMVDRDKVGGPFVHWPMLAPQILAFRRSARA